MLFVNRLLRQSTCVFNNFNVALSNVAKPSVESVKLAKEETNETTYETTASSRRQKSKDLPLFDSLTLDKISKAETPDGLSKAMRDLENCTVVGFNTESKATFIKGTPPTGPHLVQLSTTNRAFLFPIAYKDKLSKHDLDVREYLKYFLESERITKVGFGLGNDIKALKDRLDIDIKNTVDLGLKLRPAERKGLIGYKEGVANILQQKFVFDANQSKSNWSKPSNTFTDNMKSYAGNVAYVSLMVYNKWIETATISSKKKTPSSSNSQKPVVAEKKAKAPKKIKVDELTV